MDESVSRDVIRLAFLMASLTRGGAELQVVALARRLIGQGFDVDFVCRAEGIAGRDRSRGRSVRACRRGTDHAWDPEADEVCAWHRQGSSLGRDPARRFPDSGGRRPGPASTAVRARHAWPVQRKGVRLVAGRLSTSFVSDELNGAATPMNCKSHPAAVARTVAVALGVAVVVSACATASETGAAAPSSPEPSPATAMASPPTSSPGPDSVASKKPGRVVKVPASIDATGSKDVSADLQTFVENVPNGSTILFPVGATYQVGSFVNVHGRKGLTFEGNGATLKLTGVATWEGGGIQFAKSARVTLRDLTIVGNHSFAGTRNALQDDQGQHGIYVRSSRDVLIENVDISRVAGDCFNIRALKPAAGESAVWSNRVTIRDSRCTLTGRMGVVIHGAADVLIEDNVWDEIGFGVFGMEPNRSYEGAERVVIQDNEIGSYMLTDRFRPKLVYACDAAWIDGGPSTIRDVLFTRNTVTGNLSPRPGGGSEPTGLNVKICGDRGDRIDFKITDNVAAKAVEGPAMTFPKVKGVTVTGNKQKLSSGKLVDAPGATDVVVEGNDQ